MTSFSVSNARIVLVNPPLAISRSYCLSPPIGLLLVSTALKMAGHSDIHIVDQSLEFAEGSLPPGPEIVVRSAERLAAMNGDVYGFSVQCVNLPIALAIAKHLSTLRPKCRIVFGGHQATLLGGRLRNRFSFIHEVIGGSGEDSILECHRRDSGWLLPDYSAAPPWERYAAVSKQPTGLIEVSRGCPFSCTFCSIPLAVGRKLRHKPVNQVINEIDILLRNGCNEIHFVDDVFTLDGPYTRALLRSLRENGLPISWTAMTRADLVEPGLLKEMASVGCHSILYGIESADSATLQLIDKNARRYPDLIELTRWHVQADIQPTYYFLVNLPGDTAASMDRCLRVVSRMSLLDPGSCHLQLPRLVPGTALATSKYSSLWIDTHSPYAEALLLTVGHCKEVWRFIQEHPDLCTTYYQAPGPVSASTAAAMAWLGSRLFRIFPFTMAMIAEEDSLIHAFESLGERLNISSDWNEIPSQDLTSVLGEVVRALSTDVLDVFSFESWAAGLRMPDEERASEFRVSRVDTVNGRRAVQTGGSSVRVALFQRERLYQRLSASHSVIERR